MALLVRLLPDVSTVQAAGHDAVVGGLLLGASVLLVVAGLLLERSGIDPGSDERRPAPSLRVRSTRPTELARPSKLARCHAPTPRR